VTRTHELRGGAVVDDGDAAFTPDNRCDLNRTREGRPINKAKRTVVAVTGVDTEKLWIGIINYNWDQPCVIRLRLGLPAAMNFEERVLRRIGENFFIERGSHAGLLDICGVAFVSLRPHSEIGRPSRATPTQKATPNRPSSCSPGGIISAARQSPDVNQAVVIENNVGRRVLVHKHALIHPLRGFGLGSLQAPAFGEQI